MDNPKYGYGEVPNFEVVGLRQTKYPSNNALAILAILNIHDEEDPGQEEIALSVNFDHESNGYASRNLQPGEFIAKNYSEGEKLFNALLEAGWILETGEDVPSGFVECPVCRLTELGQSKLISG